MREAWPSRATGTNVTAGLIDAREELRIVAESDLVIFGDAMEPDALPLTWGQRVIVSVADARLHLLAGWRHMVTGMPDAAQPHYREPGWFTRNVFNRAVAGLTHLGVSVLGSRILETRGRKSGVPRRTPVNLLVLDGEEYLVAPRGETQWVRNVRADGGRLTLILGRTRQERIGQELDSESAIPVLRAYLKRWKAEVGVFFDGVNAESPEADVRQAATKHPVFRLTPSGAPTGPPA